MSDDTRLPDDLYNELVELAAKAMYARSYPRASGWPLWEDAQDYKVRGFTEEAALAVDAILPRLVSHLSGQAGERIAAEMCPPRGQAPHLRDVRTGRCVNPGCSYVVSAVEMAQET